MHVFGMHVGRLELQQGWQCYSKQQALEGITNKNSKRDTMFSLNLAQMAFLPGETITIGKVLLHSNRIGAVLIVMKYSL